MLNDAAKQAAMQLVESSGYQVEMDSATKQPVKVTIETDYELTRQSGNFVSIVFVSYFGRSDAAHPNKIVRSVNFNLKTGKVLTVADLLTEDEDLAEVIWEAIRDNAPPEIVDALPAETIWQNINDTAVYMTPDGIGFALPVPYALGDFYQIVVPYWEMQDFLKLDCVATEASSLTAGA